MKKDRKTEILQAAVKLAEKPGGWITLTRLAVATAAGCSESLPSAYFGTMRNFRRAIMREAIRVNNYSVIAQGLVSRDPVAMKVEPEVKRAALTTLIA
jgi:hypothetical protein